MSDDRETNNPCEPYLILMMGFIDGELSKEDEKRFKDHAYQCPSCGRHTLQPYTTYQLRCSNCGTIVKKN